MGQLWDGDRQNTPASQCHATEEVWGKVCAWINTIDSSHPERRGRGQLAQAPVLSVTNCGLFIEPQIQFRMHLNRLFGNVHRRGRQLLYIHSSHCYGLQGRVWKQAIEIYSGARSDTGGLLAACQHMWPLGRILNVPQMCLDLSRPPHY